MSVLKWALIGGAAWLGYEWLKSQAGTPAWSEVPPSTPTTTTGAGTAPTPPTQPAAAVKIIGLVKPNVNDSLTANVSINGGASVNVSIIQSGSLAGHAFDTAGKDITSALTSQGVNVGALLASFQAAAGVKSGVSGLAACRGMGLRHYFPVGAPMSRASGYVRRGY